jgi:hypothetical protein
MSTASEQEHGPRQASAAGGRAASPSSGEARLRAPRRRLAWPAGVGALFLGALAIRLIGIKTGLPYVYNADENSHFVPHAIGMFGHSLNPDYFVNPPAFTYLVHVLYAIRWGTDPHTVGNAFATDPTQAFVIARAASATLGAAAVALTAIAGARLFDDRRIGAVAGALLAVAFLAVNYSHFALNDAPTMAPIALALVGVAGIYRTGRAREYLLAGAALGVAIATKYTAGILVLTIVAAALASPVAHARLRNLALAAALACGGFLIANPYALLDHHAFTDGLRKQTETASGDEGGKLGLANGSGWAYYLGTSTWGFGWLPSLAALGGAAHLIARHRRLAAILAPAPLLLFLYLGHQSRFFARWMLPIYPLLAMLAAYGVVAAASRVRWALVPVVLLVVLQGLVFSVHNDVVLARADTRQLARDWLVQHVPAGTKMVVEPVFPDQWAADVGTFNRATSSGNRWNKWRTSRSKVANNGTIIPGAARIVKLEDYERTTRPDLVRAYRQGGFCWVVTGSTQYGRAYADPRQVPQAIKYYAALKRDADLVYESRPYGGRSGVPFSFDYSFNYYPLSYDRPGPEIQVYRLRNCTP